MKHFHPFPFHPVLYISLVCVLALTLPARAQMDSLVYGVQRVSIDPEAKGELRATLDAMPFVRDNEFKSPLVKGYTLPGVWMDPTLSYQPLKNLKLEVGAHLLRYWGETEYPNLHYSGLATRNDGKSQHGVHCVPIFRAHMQLTPALNVVVGTLYGQAQHGLARPLYNDEQCLSGDPETGVQVLVDVPAMKLDAWVNWENFIFRNDSDQEAFTFGVSARFRPSRRTARAQWYIPLQAVFQHHGGEVNFAAEDRVIKTWMNAATGVGLDLPLRTKLPASLNFELLAAAFGQNKGEALPFDNGFGLGAKAEARVWRCKATLGYWHSHDFVSILGSPLYGSMSIDHAGLTLRPPNSLAFRLEYAQPLGKGFAWGIHADVLNQFATHSLSPDLGRQREPNALNFAAGIYVRVSPSFLIKKF